MTSEAETKGGTEPLKLRAWTESRGTVSILLTRETGVGDMTVLHRAIAIFSGALNSEARRMSEGAPDYKARLHAKIEESVGVVRDAMEAARLEAGRTVITIATEDASALADYANLGRSCEANGLGWYDENGEMRFQPPADAYREEIEKWRVATMDARAVLNRIALLANRAGDCVSATHGRPSDADNGTIPGDEGSANVG